MLMWFSSRPSTELACACAAPRCPRCQRQADRHRRVAVRRPRVPRREFVAVEAEVRVAVEEGKEPRGPAARHEVERPAPLEDPVADGLAVRTGDHDDDRAVAAVRGHQLDLHAPDVLVVVPQFLLQGHHPAAAGQQAGGGPQHQEGEGSRRAQCGHRHSWRGVSASVTPSAPTGAPFTTPRSPAVRSARAARRSTAPPCGTARRAWS